MITSISHLVLFAAAWLCLASELSARPVKATPTALIRRSSSGSDSLSDPTPFEPPFRRQGAGKKRRQVKSREGRHRRTAPASSETMPLPKRDLLAVDEALASETQSPYSAEDPKRTPDDDDHLVARTNLPLSSPAPKRDVRQGLASSSQAPDGLGHIVHVQHQQRDEPITTAITPILPPELEQRDLTTTPANDTFQPELQERDILPTITTHLAHDPPEKREDLPTVTSVEGEGIVTLFPRQAFVEDHHQRARTLLPTVTSHLEPSKRQEDGSAPPASTVPGQLRKRGTEANRHQHPVQNPYNNDGSFDLTGNNFRGDAGSWKPNDHYSQEEYEKKYGNVKQALLEWWGVDYAPKKCLEDPQFDDGSEDDIGPFGSDECRLFPGVHVRHPGLFWKAAIGTGGVVFLILLAIGR